jgi:hypothetical protein
VNQSADTRDHSKEPPAILDPDWVIKMRMYLKAYAMTGRVIWVERGRKN